MKDINPKYICEKCTGLVFCDPEQIKIEDKVRFVMDIGDAQRNVRGIVVDIMPNHFLISVPGGNHVRRNKMTVTPSDAPSPLDYIFQKCCHCDHKELPTISVGKAVDSNLEAVV